MSPHFTDARYVKKTTTARAGISAIAKHVVTRSKGYMILARYGLGFVVGALLTLLLITQETPTAPPAREQVQMNLIATYRTMIQRDDILLDHFMWGTWDRDCEYDPQAGELLADGSVRITLVQTCKELTP